MNKNITKLLSVMLVAVMIVLMIPFAANAASDVEQITSLDQLTTGKYVIATDKGYAMSVIDGTWVSTQKVTATNGKITGVADNLLWEVTVSGSSVTLKDNNGKFLAPKGGNNNGIATKSYQWKVTVTNGKFVFAGTGSDTVTLAGNTEYENKFRGYKNTTVTGADKAKYPSQLCVYKVTGTSSTPAVTTPVTTAPETTAPAAPTYVTNAQARAAATNSTVYTTGVVLFIDGKNVAISDGDKGIHLYLSAAKSGLKVGDMVKATGKRGAYNGLEQLGSASIVEIVSSGNAINYKETTISAIKADRSAGGNLESTPVLLKGVTIGKVNTSGNTSVKDSAGNSINIYKCPALSGIAEGDVVDIKCVVSDFNGYQLRVASAADVVKAAAETTTTAPETTKAPETTTAAPETTVAAPETTKAPETTVAPATTVAPTTTVAPETTAPSNPSTGDASFVIIAMAALAGVAVAFIVSKKKVRA